MHVYGYICIYVGYFMKYHLKSKRNLNFQNNEGISSPWGLCKCQSLNVQGEPIPDLTTKTGLCEHIQSLEVLPGT